MYQPLGEATTVVEKDHEAQTELVKDSSTAPPGAAANSSKPSLLFLLTVIVWIACILFGLFALIHYLIPGFQGKSNVWETTDPGLDRMPKRQPTANVLLMVHWVGGIYMFAVGPLQLVPWFRRKNLNIHRWMGRFYIVGAVLTGGCATIFTVVYGTSRGWVHEDIGNVLFGGSAVLSAIQSYRTIKQGNYEQHKLWSWRLYAICLGALTYRLYLAIYVGLILYTPWQGSDWINNLSYYVCITFPNLFIVELIAKYNWKPPRWFLIATIVVLVLTTLVSFFVSWLPAMLGYPTKQTEVLDVNNGRT